MDTPRPTTIVFAIAGPLGRDELPGLCVRFRRALAESGAELAVCDVRGLPADAVALDALARVGLAAHRLGGRICLRSAAEGLRDLVSLAGLEQVLPVEPRRQAEQREQPLGVQEEGELADPAG
jgi:ABC-type transporter Mla MlaB component